MPDLATDLAGGGGGGGSGGNIWDARTPPAVPSAFDDEMTGSALAAKWSAWDPAGLLPANPMVPTRKSMRVPMTGNGGVRWAGYYQAAPGGGEYALYAKVSTLGVPLGGGSEVGLLLGQDLAGAPSTSDFRTCGQVTQNIANVQSVFSRTWAAYNGAASASASTTIWNTGYLRQRVNGVNVASDYSANGIGWVQLSSVALAFAPAQIGLGFQNVDNADTKIFFVEFFRVFAGAGTSAIDATWIGGLL